MWGGVWAWGLISWPSARHSQAAVATTTVVAPTATPPEPAEEQEATDETEDSGVMLAKCGALINEHSRS